MAASKRSHRRCSSGRSARTFGRVSSEYTVSIRRVGGRTAKHGRHQVPGLVDDLRSRHRVAGGAAHRVHAFGEPRAVGEDDLHDRHANRHEFLQRLVANELDLRALAQHGRVLHARFVVRRLERRRLVDQHDRDHVLKTDVGDVAIVHDGGHRRRQPHDEALHVPGLERVALPQDLDRVERSLDRRSDRPLLDVGPGDLVPLAELLDQDRRDRQPARRPERNCPHPRTRRRRPSSRAKRGAPR